MSEEKLRLQLVEAYDKAFTERVKQAIETKENDYIVTLIGELMERLNNLTPSRKDLHNNLRSAVDLVLIKQMLDNNAFDAAEFYKVITALLERAENIQAPADKEHTENIRRDLQSLTPEMSWADAVGPFFLSLNKVIDLIEKRRQDALNDPFIQALLKRTAELKAEKNK
jgi:hypothetical protein